MPARASGKYATERPRLTSTDTRVSGGTPGPGAKTTRRLSGRREKTVGGRGGTFGAAGTAGRRLPRQDPERYEPRVPARAEAGAAARVGEDGGGGGRRPWRTVRQRSRRGGVGRARRGRRRGGGPERL